MSDTYGKLLMRRSAHGGVWEINQGLCNGGEDLVHGSLGCFELVCRQDGAVIVRRRISEGIMIKAWVCSETWKLVEDDSVSGHRFQHLLA